MKKKSTPSKSITKSKDRSSSPTIKRPARTKSSRGLADLLNSKNIGRFLIYTLLAAIIVFVLYVRIRLLTFPLERDEGEYALMGQLILKGIPPYEMAYNMKLPGVYYLYALIMFIFGQTTIGIHLGLLLFNLGGVVLLFILGKRLGNDVLGLIASVCYGYLTLLPHHLGFAAHATQFMVPFVLGATLCLLQYEKSRQFYLLIVSGFLFGFAFIIKQHAVFLLLFGLALVIHLEWKHRPIRLLSLIIRFMSLGIMMTVPYLLVVLVAVMTDTFPQFWHWTSEYAREYISITTWEEIVKNFKENIYAVSFKVEAIWIAGVLGLIAAFFSKTVRPYRWVIFMFAISSWATVIPGYYFRPHYFILFLPALGLLVGVTVVYMQELLRKRSSYFLPLPVFLFGMAVWISAQSYNQYFFIRSPLQLCDNIYFNENPFSISMEVADYVKEHTTEQDKIAVVGSEPQIYFYANRLPATGFIYTYPLAESQPYSEDMQHEMIAEIEKEKPKYIVLINSTYSWGQSFNTVKKLLDWYLQYIQQYETVGIYDLKNGEQAVTYFGEALQHYEQKSRSSVWIMKLKE